MALTPLDQRRSVLLQGGLPERFLDALDQRAGSLLASFVLSTPRAYRDLEAELDPKAFPDCVVTPVYGDSGDTFVLQVGEGEEARFVEYSLGAGPIQDFGADVQAVLAGLLTLVWAEEELGREDVTDLAEALGFSVPLALATALADEDPQTFDQRAFLSEVLPRLLGR